VGFCFFFFFFVWFLGLVVVVGFFFFFFFFFLFFSGVFSFLFFFCLCWFFFGCQVSAKLGVSTVIASLPALSRALGSGMVFPPVAGTRTLSVEIAISSFGRFS